MNSHNKNFYTLTAKHYDTIFSKEGPKLEFVEKNLKKNEKKILDLGCATGNTAIFLARKNKLVTGLDLNEAMVEIARNKAENADLEIKPYFEICDMRLSRAEKFDALLILGNTLVHLSSLEEINDFFTSSVKKHSPSLLIVQIVNYDRILEKGITRLDDIKNQGLVFKRAYEITGSNRLITFKTGLYFDDNSCFEDSTRLFALLKDELIDSAARAGFRDIQLYGSYKEDNWSPDSFHTIAVCRK